MKKVLLVDGNSILNRAFYGIRPLSTSKGLPVNALYGMLNILQKQLDQLKPDYAAVAFDVSKHTFRHDRYSDYKAGRKGMPEELATQLPYAHKLVKALGFTVLTRQDYEADDLLGTYSLMAEKADMEAYVFTGDRDSLQLISDKVNVILASNKDNILFDKAEFVNNYGVLPEQFIYVKALMGDSSDNIPGVQGIGEKTALKLISQFGSLDALYSDVENAPVGASAKAKLIAGKDSAYMSLWLATIDRNAPVEFTLDELEYRGHNRAELYSLLTEFEFVNHIKKFGLSSDAVSEAEAEKTEISREIAASNGEIATNTEEASEAEAAKELSVKAVESVEKVKADKAALYYSEKQNAEGFTLCLCDGENIYRIECENENKLYEEIGACGFPLIVCDEKKLLNELARQFPDKTLDKAYDIDICDDVMLAAYVVNPSSHAYDLDALCTVYLGETLNASPELASTQLWRIAAELNFRLRNNGNTQNEQSGIYEKSKEASQTDLYEKSKKTAQTDLYEKSKKTAQTDLYENMELPLARVLSEMEQIGFKVDTEGLADFGRSLDALASELSQLIYMEAGHEFNINSPKQLGEVLFDELSLPHGKKTKSGYSTSIDVLEKLRDRYTIVDNILEYRSVTKLRSTYVDGLCKAADENGRVHSNFNQTITVTGRLSSTEPNLQNIPIRTEMGRTLRRFFVPKNDQYVLIDADYSQIELRLLAHIAGDQRMIDGFISGEDIHRITASQVFGVELDAVTPELRKRAKAVNFGIVYGIGEFSLAADIGVDRRTAGEYIKSYFEKYPQIAAYLTDIVEKAKRDGYVETVFGRRRYIPELNAPKAMVRAFGERVAMNSPIQGSSADIIKMAMIAVSRRLRKEKLDARLILQVHDELIIEANERDAEAASAILREEMENVVSLSVPLTVELSVGRSWYDCK